MVSFNLDKLREQLDNLKALPNIKEVVALRKRLAKELEKATPKIKKEVVAPVPTVSRNQKISLGLKKHFRYLRLIRDNFPDLTFSQLRKEFSRRRGELESEIPDAVWENPSP